VRTVLPQSVDVNNEYDDVGGVNIATFELGQVRGQLILDANADGTKSAGEGGLNDLLVDLLDSAGQVVATTSAMELDVNGDGAFDAAAEYGLFSFSGLAPGAYAIRPRLPAGWDASWARTTPLTIQGNRSGDVVTPLYGLISPYSYSHNVPSPIPANQTVHIVRTPIHIEPNGFFYQYSSRIWNGTGYEDANTVPIYQAVAGSGNFLSNCGKYSGILSIDYGEVFTNDAMDNQGLSFGVPGGCPGDGSQIRQGGIVSWNPTLPPGVLTKLQGDDTKTLYAGGRRDIVESRWVDLSFGWTQWFGYWETAREEHSKYADHVGMTARPSGQLFSFNMELHTRYKNDSTGALVATCAGHWRLDIYAPRVEIISPTPPAPWFQNAIGFPKSYAQSFSFDPCTSHEVS
jgi:hypothetical protein